jgi:hypothetical protein
MGLRYRGARLSLKSGRTNEAHSTQISTKATIRIAPKSVGLCEIAICEQLFWNILTTKSRNGGVGPVNFVLSSTTKSGARLTNLAKAG